MTFESRQQKHDEGLSYNHYIALPRLLFSPPSLFVLLFTAAIVELLRSLAPAMHPANGSSGSVCHQMANARPFQKLLATALQLS